MVTIVVDSFRGATARVGSAEERPGRFCYEIAPELLTGQ